ncbi:MAG: MFS transporter [Tumebacillaceae bacterium]
MNRWQTLFRSYHPIVWTLLLGTVMANMASSMALPFLAVYLSRTTEMSPLLIGITIGVGPLASTFGGFIGGNLSDRFGRKKVMLAALYTWALVFVGFALSSAVWAFVLLNALNGLCRSFFEPSSQALIADLTPQDRRLKAFGLRYTAINIGATLGPLVGAYLAFVSANLAFFITAIVYLLYALALSYLMAKISFEIDAGKQEKVTFRSAMNVMRRDVPLRYYLLGGILVNLGYSQVSSTLPQHVGMTIADGVTLYSVLLSFNAIVCVLLQMPLSHWAQKGTLVRAMVTGVSLFALGYLLFAVAWNWPTYILAMLVLTLGEILVFPNTSVFIDQLAENGMRGTYFGAFQFRSIGHFIGPFAGGFVLQTIGGHWLYGLCAAVVISSALCFAAGQKRYLEGLSWKKTETFTA